MHMNHYGRRKIAFPEVEATICIEATPGHKPKPYKKHIVQSTTANSGMAWL